MNSLANLAPATQSKAARIRELMPDIINAMGRGVSQREIVAALAVDGLDISIDQLRNALYRERKKSPKKGTKPQHETKTPPPPDAKAPAFGMDWSSTRNRLFNEISTEREQNHERK